MSLTTLLLIVSMICLVLFLWGIAMPKKAFLGENANRGSIIKIYGLGFIITIFIAGIIANKQEGSALTETTQTTAVKNLEIPAREADFISIVAEAQQASKGAGNDMQRGGFKANREKKLCQTMTSLHVTNWIGRVNTITANSDGKGVLAIEVAEDITVKTWNNSLSDIDSNTLIEPGTKLFSTASTFKEGQMVKFSGTLLKGSAGNCLQESSLSLSGKLSDPEFIFRFSEVAPI